MPGEIRLTNRQETRSINLLLLKRITRFLIGEQFRRRQYEFGVHLVSAPEMAQVNQQFLNHAGSTDVITFDYAARGGDDILCGEAFICIDDAVRQAREDRTTWQSELVRYLIHALLHLEGYDDLQPQARKKMKREEEAILKRTAEKFKIERLRKSATEG